jgi:hypothetical protein
LDQTARRFGVEVLVIEDLLALLVMLRDLSEALSLASEIIDNLTAAYDLLIGLGEPSYAELDEATRTMILKRCTKIIANLNSNLACYPTGYNTTVLFDLDGNLLP